MNLHLAYTPSSLKTLHLCGATPSDLLHFIELHFGHTARSPLGSGGRGYYLRSGPNATDPILAAAGDRVRLSMLKVEDGNNDGREPLAELVFESVWSTKHVFRLELNEAGATGQLGDRWALAVVMSALSLCWMRQYGRTNKSIAGR
ncbi:hypothetical protein N0V88_000624 [Collariella sp. IMI 366227]|nr:hypothetical protein N0V88_000624 [Collariella sp. IMI 366227]